MIFQLHSTNIVYHMSVSGLPLQVWLPPCFRSREGSTTYREGAGTSNAEAPEVYGFGDDRQAGWSNTGHAGKTKVSHTMSKI